MCDYIQMLVTLVEFGKSQKFTKIPMKSRVKLCQHSITVTTIVCIINRFRSFIFLQKI